MTTDTKRLFFACWPDQATRDYLVSAINERAEEGWRLQHPVDLHMTLAFLGQVELSRLAAIAQAVDQLSFPSFSLTLDRLGHWQRPRILWCGPSKPVAELTRFVEDLQSVLHESCGFTPEDRPYQPHVTLARKVREWQGESALKSHQWRVGSFAMAVSHSGVEPPRYEIFKKWFTDS